MMNKEETEQFDVTLLLLFSAERRFTEQKAYEAIHGGLVGYYSDPFLLIKLQEHLTEPKVRERLETILKML